jgi:asparagine synthase (glutamine-hydrolysing)
VKRPDVKLDSILTAIFRDTLETIPEGSRIVVPLSGGHDSRIVVNYLYKLGFRNVLCYTYGVKDTLQAKISQQVAAALGYEWHFMEYTEDKWHEVQASGEFDRYLDYGFRGVSNPLISDLLPVRELKQRNILKEGDIFMPGHGLDYLAGNDLTEEDFECTTEEDALDLVFRNSIRAGEYEHRRSEALWPAASDIYRRSGVDPDQFHLHFFWQEDEAKFIVNSNRLYEYFGYDTRIPLLDIRLIRFWLSVDRRLNIRRKFLFDLEREWLHVDELKSIPFDREVQKPDQKPVGSGIKKWIPASLKRCCYALQAVKK